MLGQKQLVINPAASIGVGPGPVPEPGQELGVLTMEGDDFATVAANGRVEQGVEKLEAAIIEAPQSLGRPACDV